MKKTILIIDDEPEITKYLCSKLEKENFKTVVAADGQEGYDILFKQNVDAIVTDLSMSPIDGYEFCRKIKDSDKLQDIPILICTAHPSSEGTFRKIGIDDYLVKPFPPEDLVRSLNRILSQVSHHVKFMKILVQTNNPLQIERVEQQMQAYGYRTDVSIIPEEENIIEQTLILQPDIVIFNALKTTVAPEKVIQTLKSYPELKDVKIIFYANHPMTTVKPKKGEDPFGKIKEHCLEAGATSFMGLLSHENLIDVVMDQSTQKNPS